jgi:MFS transporter, DHA3 family, macrolide efflux protein
VFIFAVAQLGMSFANNGVLVLMSYALFGITVAFFFPMVTTVFQNRLEQSIQGRFFSFKEMIDRVLFQISAGSFAVMYGRFRTLDYKHTSKNY